MTGASNEPEIEAFARCWNSGDYFMAHEVLEGLWTRRRDDGLQGLIQLAVSLHNIHRGNLRGAAIMIERARRRLANPKNALYGIDLKMMDDYAARVGRVLDNSDAGESRSAIEMRPLLSV